MYLVHARLQPPAGSGLPADVAELVACCALPADQLELTVAHPAASDGRVTVGLWLLAPGLDAAERTAERVCLRALAVHAELAGCTLTHCEVPLIGDRNFGRIGPEAD